MKKLNKKTIEQAEKDLSKKDSILANLIAEYGPVEIMPRTNYFESLSRSIVGQQISVHAARSVYEKFEKGTNLDPQIIEVMEPDELREFGLSRQKAGYLIDLAAHFSDDPEVYQHLDELEDGVVTEELTKIKGIGVWTSQMFLMFSLNRADVFAPDDLGLQRAIRANYPDLKFKRPKDYLEFAERWRPYRTVASIYLWHSLENSR